MTLTSRLFQGPDGTYGAPLSVGRVSATFGVSFREGLVTFEPWLFVANLAITVVILLPLVPTTRTWSTTVVGVLAGALGYSLWLWRLDPGAAFQALDLGELLEYDGLFHPLVLWLAVVLSTLVGMYIWRRRSSRQVSLSFGSLRVAQLVIALALSLLVQLLVTYTSVFARGWYGAPIPVGRSSGASFLIGDSMTVTFEPWIFIANLALTAGLIFRALPAQGRWRAGVVGTVTTILGFVAFFGLGGLLLQVAPAFKGAFQGALPWLLWANLVLWALGGIVFPRHIRIRFDARRPEP